jgi:hypothetical protein
MIKLKNFTIIICLFAGVSLLNASEIGDKLMKYYSDAISKVDGNYVYFKDGTKLVFDDKKKKSFDETLNNPDIKDQFACKYIKGTPKENPKLNDDPGRIRNQDFFKKLYGSTKEEVKKNLVSVKFFGRTLQFSNKYGAADSLKKIVKELEALGDEYLPYLQSCGGSFNWRKVAKTDYLSPHSYGIAIDINTSKSDYWLWAKGSYKYRNRIPQQIVDIFEKYGFVWGGKWYHFDTMHFEYRPELF